MNAYEMTFIVRPDLDEDATRAAVERVTGRVETAGGELLATVPWNPPRRRMAYPIRDFGDGYYVTTVFRLDAQQVRPFENQLKLNDNVVRFLLVQATDTNIQQAQLRVAQAAAAAARPPAAATPAPHPIPPSAPAAAVGPQADKAAIAPEPESPAEVVEESETTPETVSATDTIVEASVEPEVTAEIVTEPETAPQVVEEANAAANMVSEPIGETGESTDAPAEPEPVAATPRPKRAKKES